MKKKHKLLSTEVMPRAFLKDFSDLLMPVPRAISAPSDASTNNIMISGEAFDKSTLATYYPDFTWTYANYCVRQWREAHHDPSDKPDFMDLTDSSEPTAPV